MKLSPKDYAKFGAWAVGRRDRLAEPARTQFTDELFMLPTLALGLLQSLPEGRGLPLLLGLAAWIKRTPDPMEPLRLAMAGMRERWKEEP